jgi:hypothetical protein
MYSSRGLRDEAKVPVSGNRSYSRSGAQETARRVQPMLRVRPRRGLARHPVAESARQRLSRGPDRGSHAAEADASAPASDRHDLAQVVHVRAASRSIRCRGTRWPISRSPSPASAAAIRCMVDLGRPIQRPPRARACSNSLGCPVRWDTILGPTALSSHNLQRKDGIRRDMGTASVADRKITLAHTIADKPVAPNTRDLSMTGCLLHCGHAALAVRGHSVRTRVTQ